MDDSMKNNKVIALFVLFSVLFFANARADQNNIVYEHNYRNSTETYIENPKNYTGVASAISAAQCHFDFATDVLQGCASVAGHNGGSAVSFGLGKRFGRTLINGACSIEGEYRSCGGGVNWRF